MIWTLFAAYFLGTIGGATTFASAKVKNAIGRIGIFFCFSLKCIESEEEFILTNSAHRLIGHLDVQVSHYIMPYNTDILQMH